MYIRSFVWLGEISLFRPFGEQEDDQASLSFQLARLYI